MIMSVTVILCPSQTFILGTYDLFLELHSIPDGKECVSGWIFLPRATPILDLNNLHAGIGDF